MMFFGLFTTIRLNQCTHAIYMQSTQTDAEHGNNQTSSFCANNRLCCIIYHRADGDTCACLHADACSTFCYVNKVLWQHHYALH